jgi:hypothetical protein
VVRVDRPVTLAGLVILMLLLGGCRGEAPEPSAEGEGEESAADAVEPELVAVYLQAPSHPTRSYVRVSGIAAAADRIFLEAGLSNAADRALEFNASGVNLRDEAGHTYPLLPPPDNATLRVRPGATLTGMLVFSGTPAAGSTLELTFNDGSVAGTWEGTTDRAGDDPLIVLENIELPDPDAGT